MDTITSEKFIDMLIDKGALMNWYFLFMPVGNMKYILSPKERIEFGRNLQIKQRLFRGDLENLQI